MNKLSLVFNQIIQRMRLNNSSLTIWKADINTGIYMTNTVSRCCLYKYRYQAVSYCFINNN